MLRQLETWLHQHIFKVGWLTTKNLQTTTILYYTFFFPGVLLYEVTYWLAAGFLNVRAEHVFQWPKAQEIGKLELNFVQLARNVSPIRLAFIALAPLGSGLLVIWLIANYIFNLPNVLQIMSGGTLNDIVLGFRALVYAPDFWLWFYIAFTIGNTMMPDWEDIKGLKIVMIVTAAITAILVFIGVGNAIVLQFFSGPLTQTINILSGLFIVMIAMDVFGLAILSAIENTIEVITGDSADFKNGKMVVMTRQERLAQRLREVEKERLARQKRRTESQKLDSGPPSIYNLPLPVMGEPTSLNITPISKIVKPERDVQKLAEKSQRAGADLISGKLDNDDDRRLQSGGQQPQLPQPKTQD